MISIIIPTLDEEEHLPETIRRASSGPEIPFEIIVVDGHSRDATREVARRAGAAVLECPVRQRAAQMNFGARAARGETLLFLHADTWLPASGLTTLQKTLADRPGVVGGAFARRFAILRPENNSPPQASAFLALTCLLAELRNRCVGWHLGDQAIFARREAFVKLGGYKPMARFEDLDFSRRLASLGQLATLRPPVLTSHRRFLRLGPIRTTGRDLWLTCRYLARLEK